ncbi:MAG: 4-hydroxy-tetrahydrodipicolinate reductase [archaeon]|nr:4-hydroxy-tetrahydrodipicolinate reductase [archaeon]
MIKIGIIGADGSMGRLIASLAIKDEDISIVLAYTIPESPNIGMDVGTMVGTPPINTIIKSINSIEYDLKEEKPDIFIDFTVAEATEKNSPSILNSGVPMVIGSTGLSDKFIQQVKEIINNKKIPVVISSNYAIGVNVVFKMAAEFAKKLPGWEIEIIEAHHHRKKDVPSGTALTIAKNISTAINVDLEEVGQYGRGKGPNPRKWGNDEIGIHSVRGGDIVGDHIVLYAGNGERIELKHQAHSRNCFASGSIEAIKFLMKNLNNPKIFDMQDILGLK